MGFDTEMILPRGMKRKTASAYCGFSVGHFDRGVREGWLPKPVNAFGVKLWLRESLDDALDQLDDEGGNTCDDLFPR